MPEQEHQTVPSPEGSVAAPADARRLLEQVWANNHSSAGDSVRDVRAARDADVQADADAQERIDAAISDSRGQSTAQATADLLAGIGFDR